MASCENSSDSTTHKAAVRRWNRRRRMGTARSVAVELYFAQSPSARLGDVVDGAGRVRSATPFPLMMVMPAPLFAAPLFPAPFLAPPFLPAPVPVVVAGIDRRVHRGR